MRTGLNSDKNRPEITASLPQRQTSGFRSCIKKERRHFCYLKNQLSLYKNLVIIALNFSIFILNSG
jgi:hypothetical protein